jgi:hypothetical protein
MELIADGGPMKGQLRTDLAWGYALGVQLGDTPLKSTAAPKKTTGERHMAVGVNTGPRSMTGVSG